MREKSSFSVGGWAGKKPDSDVRERKKQFWEGKMVRLLSMGIECVSSMIFLVPVMFALQYILFRRRSFYQFVMVLVLAAYLSAVFSVTGIPDAYTLRIDLRLNLLPLVDIVNSPVEYIRNSILNIILFMPLGFLLPVLWHGYRDGKRMVFIGFAVSVLIEALQIFSFRFTDIDDLIMNTLGTALGYGIAKMISFKLPFGISEKISEKEKKVCVKQEAVVVFTAVFLIVFFLKPLVSDAMWDVVLSSAWWERIR